MYFRDRNGGEWAERQKLMASDGGMGDRFGRAVALHNNVIVAGAAANNNENGIYAGKYAVFVFQYVAEFEPLGAAYIYTTTDSGVTWMQRQKLLASEGAPYDNFGHSTAIS